MLSLEVKIKISDEECYRQGVDQSFVNVGSRSARSGSYVHKELLSAGEMNQRAAMSEHDVETGKIISAEQFQSDFEKWKRKKRETTK